MANASNQPKQWRGWSTNRFLETSATFPGMALLNGAKRGIPISSLRRNTEEQERKKKRKERNKKKKKKKSSNPSRDFLSPRRATIHGQRSPADPLPFEFLRLPSVNATGNYHSRHCRPLLSRLRIIIVLCGESSKSKRKKKKNNEKKKVHLSWIKTLDRGRMGMNYTARSIRLVNRGRDYASYAFSPLAFSLSFSVFLSHSLSVRG